METTRKYPRTLNQAFPRTAEYGNAIKCVYAEPTSHKVARFVFVAILAAGCLAGLLEYFGVLTQ